MLGSLVLQSEAKGKISNAESVLLKNLVFHLSIMDILH